MKFAVAVLWFCVALGKATMQGKNLETLVFKLLKLHNCQDRKSNLYKTKAQTDRRLSRRIASSYILNIHTNWLTCHGSAQ